MTLFRGPGFINRLLRLRSPVETVAPPQTDVFVISYPKTGRTWLRMMVGKYLCLRYSLDASQVLQTRALTDHADLRVTAFKHDGSNLRKQIPFRDLQSSKSDYRSKRVLLLTRSIEDSMVSAYFQVSSRLKIYDGSISEFLRDERYGVDKFIRFYRDWFLQQDVPERFEVVSYEQMQMDPARVLKIALTLVCKSEIEDQWVRAAVDYCSFENMRKIEQSHQLAKPMRPTHYDDPNSCKVRRGIVGGYVSYLSPDDLDFIRKKANEVDCPFVRLCPQGAAVAPEAS